MVVGRLRAPSKVGSTLGFEGFSCGDEVVDQWVQQHLAHALKYRSASVWAVSDERGDVLGFYTLSAHCFDRASAPGRLRRNRPNPVPAILLGMLGVRSDCRGMGMGLALVADAIKRSSVVAQTMRACALLVEPASLEARGFWGRAGFTPLADSPTMFLVLPDPAVFEEA